MNKKVKYLIEHYSTVSRIEYNKIIHDCIINSKYILEICNLSDNLVEDLYLIKHDLKELPKCICGKEIDRDYNASLNIKNEGIRILTSRRLGLNDLTQKV